MKLCVVLAVPDVSSLRIALGWTCGRVFQFWWVGVDLDSDLTELVSIQVKFGPTQVMQRCIRTLSSEPGAVQTYWTVIDQSNIHHGSKDAVLDFVGFIEIPNLFVKGFVERPGFVTVCRLVKRGLAAFFQGGK